MAKAKKAQSRREDSRKKQKAKVRRSGPKKLPKRIEARSLPFMQWMNEVAFVAFALGTVLLAGALISFHFSRVSVVTGTIYGDPTFDSNIMGTTGHMVATFLVGMLGYASYSVVILLGGIAAAFWLKSQEKVEFGLPSIVGSVAGILGYFIASTLFVVVILGDSAAGMLGAYLCEPIVRSMGSLGASLAGVALLLICTGLLCRLTPWEVIEYCGRFCWAAVKFTATAAAHVLVDLWWLTRSFFSACYELLLSFMPHHDEEEEEEDDEPLPDPKPRKKKKKRAQVREVSEDKEEEAREIVVRRRSRANSKKKPKKKLRRRKVRKQVVDGKSEARPPYIVPDVALLTKSEETVQPEEDELLRRKSRLIESKLNDFSIAGRVKEVHPGPVITLFEFEPAPGVKVGKIASLQDDLAMSLRASSIRIIAPIPKKGTVGIEVPNKQREIVRLRDVLESDEFNSAQSSLTVALGKNTYGDPVVTDIARMPHLLIAGATGTGKSVCINTLLLSLLYRSSPEDLGLILIDPKILELSIYEGIPHLRSPVVTRPKQARAVLEWAVQEMDRRYRLMHKYSVRSIDGYNALASGEDVDEAKQIDKQAAIELVETDIVEEGKTPTVDAPKEPQQPDLFSERLEKLPKIVIVIDELADLMLSVGRDIEDLIARLAQKARAAGIHLIVATQRPSVDVITGLIKANFPARLSFRVSSRIDSRTILDSMGAEKLLGMGDMLLMFPGAVHVHRLHGAFVSDNEVKRVIQSVKQQGEPCYDSEIVEACDKALTEDSDSKSSGYDDDQDFDPLYDEAVNFVLEKGKASTSMLQRAFRIGYNRAARIVDIMEREGVVGPVNGAKPRDVLVNTLEEEAAE